MKQRFRFTLQTLLVATAALAVCLAWFVNWWQSRQNFAIVTMGGSQAMEPFIDGRTYLAVDMNAYRRAKPARGEAVVFHLQQPSTAGRAPTVCILRVIGLPGETVSFSEGKVFIDGQPIDPPSSAPSGSGVHVALDLQNVRYHIDDPDVQVVPHPYTVPDGRYYLLGDNPEAANDSRMWGALPEAEILSRYPTQVSEPDRAWPTIYIAALVVLGVLYCFFRCRKGLVVSRAIRQ